MMARHPVTTFKVLKINFIIIIIIVPVRAECRIGREQKISILACY